MPALSLTRCRRTRVRWNPTATDFALTQSGLSLVGAGARRKSLYGLAASLRCCQFAAYASAIAGSSKTISTFSAFRFCAAVVKLKEPVIALRRSITMTLLRSEEHTSELQSRQY